MGMLLWVFVLTDERESPDFMLEGSEAGDLLDRIAMFDDSPKVSHVTSHTSQTRHCIPCHRQNCMMKVNHLIHHSAQTPVKKFKKSSKKVWTEQLQTEQRERDKADLQQLQKRTNYLKNPRFDPAQAKVLTAPSRPQAKEINVKKPLPQLEPISKVQVGLRS